MEMFLDVSHLNDDGFEDVDWIAQKPFLATHSNSRRVWFNYRNLRDDQMRRLAARGGMMGLNGCRCIVGCEGDQDPLEMLCRHVEYEAALISPEHVGYGFDFCDSLSAAQSGLEISARTGRCPERPPPDHTSHRSPSSTWHAGNLCTENHRRKLLGVFPEDVT